MKEVSFYVENVCHYHAREVAEMKKMNETIKGKNILVTGGTGFIDSARAGQLNN